MFHTRPFFCSWIASLWLAMPRPTCTAPPTTPATGSTTAPAMPAAWRQEGAQQVARAHAMELATVLEALYVPVASPLAKPAAPSCWAPTIGAAKRPTTPLAIPAAAVAAPLFRPAAAFFGRVFLTASAHSRFKTSRGSSSSAGGVGAGCSIHTQEQRACSRRQRRLARNDRNVQMAIIFLYIVRCFSTASMVLCE